MSRLDELDAKTAPLEDLRLAHALDRLAKVTAQRDALLEAVGRAASYQVRESRIGRGLIPVDQVENIQRTLRTAIAACKA